MFMRSSLCCAVAAAASLGTVATAAFVDLNVSGASLSSLNGIVTARYRFDGGGGVDHMLFKQPSPAGYPASDRLRMDGSNTGTAAYQFSLSHNAATDTFTYSLSNGIVAGGASFANAGVANGTVTRTFSAGELSYNILHIYMLTDSGATASFSNLAFNAGPGLTTTGALQTAASITNGSYDQWLAAQTGTNLDDFDWSMTADVTLAMNGTRPSAERLKFEITGKAGDYIPAPGAIALLAGAGLIVFRRRR